MQIPESLKNSKQAEIAYSSWINQTIDLVSPKDLFLVGGRGTSKTTEIQAERSQNVIYDMPRAYSAFVADTYDNALRNIVPSLLEGWTQRRGWREGVHFVVDERPPEKFAKPYKPPMTYKHTISTFNGHFFNLGSLAQPTSLAGNSYQHFFIDEAKNCNYDKLKKLFPALRGDYVQFGHSPFFLGMTVTTDMPNIGDGEHDWILDREKDMNKEQVIAALQAGLELNDLRIKLIKAKQTGNKARIKSLQNRFKMWFELWYQSRMDLTMFYTVSSFTNAEILRKNYFKIALDSLGLEEFKSAILSLKSELKAGERFYMNLGTHHYYDDGLLIDYYKKNFRIGDKIEGSSQGLRYIKHDKKLECGIDFGNQCSMVLGQPAGQYYYLLKNLYTLAPESSKELAKKFIDFFKNHKTKVLDMYYDRSGNQYEKVKRDWATEIKNHIEKYEGTSTGWRVNLMSRNQATISQEQEFVFAKKLLGEYYPELPKMRIDRHQCRELKSSLELAKTKIGKDRNGNTQIKKDKDNEKNLPLKKLPLYSTNFSDAFKYLVYRRDWVRLADRKSSSTVIDPSTH
ncbi:hypothetical protein J0871_16935 [Salegentibacter sp. BDJ18]|uniref:hypothetical protein n=1 Tax=Salegentibacter sp. BDJ18 TaxID=2816376 RepID=UPI001AAF77E2|nr:hypothetical protein [Salegentibacter sp. BDJ18]MBO2546104.1 hypothetical protein [Salegentibacter sp. BDJ18]